MKNRELFNYLHEELGMLVVESEVEEIVRIVNKQDDRWYLGTWIGGIFGGIMLTFIGLFFYNVYQANPETCTCRFAQHRVHFGDQYTKVNRKCWQNGHGHVVVGDTVYLDVKWFTNECE